MLYRETIAIRTENCTEHINVLFGQNVEVLSVKILLVGYKDVTCGAFKVYEE